MTYTTLTYGQYKKGETDKVVDILQDLISKGNEPDVPITLFYTGYAREKALNFLNEMIYLSIQFLK